MQTGRVNRCMYPFEVSCRRLFLNKDLSDVAAIRDEHRDKGQMVDKAWHQMRWILGYYYYHRCDREKQQTPVRQGNRAACVILLRRVVIARDAGIGNAILRRGIEHFSNTTAMCVQLAYSSNITKHRLKFIAVRRDMCKCCLVTVMISWCFSTDEYSLMEAA